MLPLTVKIKEATSSVIHDCRCTVKRKGKTWTSSVTTLTTTTQKNNNKGNRFKKKKRIDVRCGVKVLQRMHTG